MEKIYHLKDFDVVKRASTDSAERDGNYLCIHFTPESSNVKLSGSLIRVGGLMMGLIRHGQLKGEIDGKEFVLTDNSLFTCSSSNVFKFTEIDWAHHEATFVIFAPKFLRDLNIDVNAINITAMMDKRPENVILDLSAHTAGVFQSYMNLLFANARDDNEASFAKNIARSLTQAMFYQLLQLRSERQKSIAASGEQVQTRQVSYVHEFLQLVGLHHGHYRNIGFYADKLCISPKYLSHIIKETTGRSAAEWIGEVVVQEAKNMLRFSNKNVQQVAYELNFPTQSSFGKYFKNITGISPTEFKKR